MGAFRAMLEELRDADILLHLVDASTLDPQAHVEAVESILSELGLVQIPRLLVFNKCDRLPPGEADSLCRRYGAIGVSALQPKTLAPVSDALDRMLPEVLHRRRAGEAERAAPAEPLASQRGAVR